MDNDRSRVFTASSIPDGYERFMLRQLFEPWAGVLVDRAELRPGQSVLDVASGLGPVARAAALAVGVGGRVVASDISPGMLAVAATTPAAPGSAPIEYLECSADSIGTDDDSVDAVCCQQGLQFFPDRAVALREMRRVVRQGGIVALSTWAAEHPLGMFGPIAETLRAVGLEEPFSGAFDPTSYSLGAAEVAAALERAQWREVTVETIGLDAEWRTIDDAVSVLLGTPFGPMVTALPPGDQDEIRTLLADRLDRSEDGTVVVRTTSTVATGRK